MLTHRTRSILGEIPADWQVKSIKQLTTQQFSGDWGDDDGEKAVSVIRSTNFTSHGHVDLNDVATRYFPSQKAETFGLNCGDLIVERSGGGPEQPVGRIGFIPENMPDTTVSNFVQVLRPNVDEVDPSFLGWVLYELQRTGSIERVQQQSTQMRNLNWRDYLRLLLPWPAIDEQRRITAALKLADKAIVNANNELDAIRNLKRSLMDHVFENGLVGGVETKACKIHECYTAQIPTHWNDDNLGKSLLIVEYGSNAASNDYRGGYPIIAIPQVVAPQLTLTDVPYAEVAASEADALRLLVDDVLLIRTNGNPQYIGKSTIVSKEVAETHTIFASYLIRLRSDRSKLVGAYLNYFLASPLGRRQAGAVANTSAGNNNIGARAIKHFRFPRPPLSEQEKVVALFDGIEAKINAQERVVNATLELKRSLLQNLLTGKLRLPQGIAHA